MTSKHTLNTFSIRVNIALLEPTLFSLSILSTYTKFRGWRGNEIHSVISFSLPRYLTTTTCAAPPPSNSYFLYLGDEGCNFLMLWAEPAIGLTST
jgi:hypothetical protein